MTEATITVEDKGGLKIVHISGQLDESNVDAKIQDVYKLLEATPKGLKIILDLENLEYMNSKSIGYITDIYGKTTEGGGKIVIANAKPNITDILQVVGLTQLINSFSTMDEAQASMGGDQTTPVTPEVAPAEMPAAPMEVTPTPEPEVETPAVETTPEAAPAEMPAAPMEVTPTPEAAPAEMPAAAPTDESYKFEQ